VPGFVLAQTSVVPALGEMQRAFGASASDITWMVTAYLLVASIATPIFGRLVRMFTSGSRVRRWRKPNRRPLGGLCSGVLALRAG
jgi:MFS family permease